MTKGGSASPASSAGGYTSPDVSRLLGLPAATIHAWVRAGFLEPRRGRRGEYRFTLQDLVLLRTAKGLAETVPPRRLGRALRSLKAQLPQGRPLTGVRITSEGDSVVVHDGSTVWEPTSGQRLFDFEVAALAREVAPLARRAAEEARTAEREMTAEDWYYIGCDLEPCDPDQARDAYRRALELDVGHADARLNLGRLLHEAGLLAAAEMHYRLALTSRPRDATAAFNLGVALEDLGRAEEAIAAYETSLELDPRNPDAHFNISRLLELCGRKAPAFRHLKAYRQLTAR